MKVQLPPDEEYEKKYGKFKSLLPDGSVDRKRHNSTSSPTGSVENFGSVIARIFVTILGMILLLPGICVLLFGNNPGVPMGQDKTAIIVVAVLLAVVGLALIRKAFRN